MFVQVIRGQVVDPGQVNAAHDRWFEEVAPGADGWLGTTAGVSGGGDLIGLIRFESEKAARRNGSRPEQAMWWAQTAKLFTGEVTVTESGAAYVDRGGASTRRGSTISGSPGTIRRAELRVPNSSNAAAGRPPNRDPVRSAIHSRNSRGDAIGCAVCLQRRHRPVQYPGVMVVAGEHQFRL